MTSFEIAKNEVDNFIRRKDSFSYEELCVSIINKGGVLRVSTYQSLSEYLHYHIDERNLFYNEYTDKFDFLLDKKSLRKKKLEKIRYESNLR